MNTKEHVEAIFLKIQEENKHILSQLEGLSDEQLNAHLPEKWSILQILEHLRVAEKQSIKVMLRGFEEINNPGQVNFIQKLKLSIYKILLKSGFKFKAPPHVSKLPEILDLETLISKWNENRAEWQNFLNKIDEQKLDIAIFPHPILGPLSVKLAVDFVYAHQSHHIKQVEKLVNSFQN